MKKKKFLVFVSVLVVAVSTGITAFGANELGLIGNNNRQTANQAANQTAAVTDHVQEITTWLEPSSYPVLVVQKGVPVKWTITADNTNLNGCNDEITIPGLGISKPLKIGENVIEFTVDETGIIPYSCWMGMIQSAIVVVEDINNYEASEIEKQIEQLPQSSSSCGMGGSMSGGGCCGGRFN